MNNTGSNSVANGSDGGKNGARLQSVIGKQSVRKMSTMPEEEDTSDDMDPDVIRIGHYQPPHEADSDSLSEDRGRLLSSADPARRTTITPTNSGNLQCNGLKKDKPSRLQPTSKLLDQPVHFEGRLIREGALRSGRHHRCSSVRSVKSNPTMDEHHHPAASWASVVFSDGNGQTYVRPFPESVSIRSLASIGMGSSDGRKLTIRRVPTSPSELLNMVHPPP